MSTPALPLAVKPVVESDAGPGGFAHAGAPAVWRVYLGPPDLVGPSGCLPPQIIMPGDGGRFVGARPGFFSASGQCWRARPVESLSNSLEKRWSLGGCRLVNLDPGYVARERLVLATGKNFSIAFTWTRAYTVI